MGDIAKTIKGKIIFKHETESDWAQSSYVPALGEKVLYDPDSSYSYTRVKYGDGKTTVSELPFSNLQADWGETDESSSAFIIGKPEIPSSLVDLTDDATHRTVTDTEKANWNKKSDFSGSYNDLADKPSVVVYTAQALTDEQKAQARANIGAGESGFSGSYNDLTDKPDIPSSLADLTDDATHRTVTDTEKVSWNEKSDFSGSYNDLTDKPSVVVYTAQTLTDEQKAQARTNIGAISADEVVSSPDAVTYTEQTLTTDQQAQARTNIGAAPAYTYGTEDLTAGTSELATGTLYFVYE